MSQYIYWQYLLTLDADLATSARFVEFAPDNYSTYSTEFTRILLAAGSEVDVVAKALCNRLCPGGKHKDINDYRSTITASYPKLHQTKVNLPAHDLWFMPWSDWKGGANPSWWQAYNQVKHHRESYYPKACLENALLAVAGLLIMVLYYHRPEFEQDDFASLPRPNIMTTEEFIHGYAEVGWSLPDFP